MKKRKEKMKKRKEKMKKIKRKDKKKKREGVIGETYGFPYLKSNISPFFSVGNSFEP